jgi:hypothetical protein
MTMSDDTKTKSVRQRVKDGPPPSGNTDLRNRDLSRTNLADLTIDGEDLSGSTLSETSAMPRSSTLAWPTRSSAAPLCAKAIYPGPTCDRCNSRAPT